MDYGNKDAFLEENGYENDINEKRLHHEIYMSDARKVAKFSDEEFNENIAIRVRALKKE